MQSLEELHKLARSCMEQGNMSGALSTTEKILERVGDGDVELRAKLMANIGFINAASQNFIGAKEAFEEAADLFLSLKKYLGQAMQIGNIGSIYRDKGEYDMALFYYHKAITTLQDNHDKDNPDVEIAIANQHSNIAFACSQIADAPGAAENFERAAEIYERYGLADQARMCRENLTVLQKTSGSE